MILQVHGFMMFFAWGLFFPGGAMVARYFKHINQDGWMRWVISDMICIVLLGMLWYLKTI